MKHLLSFVALLTVFLSPVRSIEAAEPATPAWILITLYLDVTNGELRKVDQQPRLDLASCIKDLDKISPVENGLAKFYICRRVDADGNPVPEVKVDPNGKPLDPHAEEVSPDAPKVII